MMSIDLDALRAEFEREYAENTAEANPPEPEEPESQEEPESPEASNADLPEEDRDSEPEAAESEETGETGEADGGADEGEKPELPSGMDRQPPEVNRAFAEMRRKAKELEVFKDFVERVAAQSGMTPEQLMQVYEDRVIEQKAKEQNIPVDVYKRLHKLEQENKEIRRQAAIDKFNAQVDSVKTKYGLSDKDLDAVFRFIGENGLVDPATNLPVIDFEIAYKAATYDQMKERSAREAEQKYLAQKKRRQQQSPVPHTGGQAPQLTHRADWPIEKVEKYVRERYGVW